MDRDACIPDVFRERFAPSSVLSSGVVRPQGMSRETFEDRAMTLQVLAARTLVAATLAVAGFLGIWQKKRD